MVPRLAQASVWSFTGHLARTSARGVEIHSNGVELTLQIERDALEVVKLRSEMHERG